MIHIYRLQRSRGTDSSSQECFRSPGRADSWLYNPGLTNLCSLSSRSTGITNSTPMYYPHHPWKNQSVKEFSLSVWATTHNLHSSPHCSYNRPLSSPSLEQDTPINFQASICPSPRKAKQICANFWFLLSGHGDRVSWGQICSAAQIENHAAASSRP